MLTTTLTLNRKSRGLLRDTQAIHRTLAHANDGTCLWGLPDHTHLVVRHDHPIDWATSLDGIVTQAVTTPTQAPITGAPIQWALIANPTKSVMEGGKRGKRRALPPEAWNAWVDRKLGEAINLARIDGTALPTGVGNRHGKQVIHRRVLFTGDGTVKNQTTLHDLMQTGVGPGKAYGCGLLLVETAA